MNLDEIRAEADRRSAELKKKLKGEDEPPRYLDDGPPPWEYEDRSRQRSDDVQVSAERKWPKPIDLVALGDKEPEPPAFIIDDWLPCGYATLFAGHGGVGKSGIALHLAACIALGRPFFGMSVKGRSKVVYLSCEDRESILHWRLHHICRYMGVSLRDLSDQLHLLDLVGRDAILWSRDPRTGATYTPSFGELADRIRSEGYMVMMADGITDTFGGNENSRSEVKQFVNSLVGMMPAQDGSTFLLGHVAKLGTEGYSGTTAWHNAARARWYLYPEKGPEDNDRTGSLLLELAKTNHGRADQSMRFAWNESAHMFLGELVAGAATMTNFDRKHRDREERAGILAALRASIVAVGYVPAAAQGSRTAYNVLSIRPEFPNSLKGDSGKRRFWRHMEALQQSGEVGRDIHHKGNRNKTEVFTV